MTIRLKVTMAAIAVILVANSLLSLVGLEYAERVWLREVRTRVRLDLNSARNDYDGHIAGIARFLHAVTLDGMIVDALRQSELAELGAFLEDVHHAGGMDFVSLLDPQGKVICRAHGGEGRGDDLSDHPLIHKVLQEAAPVSGTVLLSADSLAREGRDLADRVLGDGSPGRAGPPQAGSASAEGMVVCAAVPLRDSQGKLAGILYAGDVLNQRFEIVDSIKKEVFAEQTYEGKEIGAVTIFQGDRRISTSLTGEDGARAVGTRLSNTVRDEVLVGGGTWADRALVVEDWYHTAYEPIRDAEGQVVGVLGIGLLEAPFVHKQNVLVGFFLAMVVMATLASLVLVFFVTTQVLRPIGHITAMSRKVIEGDLGARVGIRPSGEMGVVCRAIDSMAEALAEREEQLKTAARQQIGQSEKLASIGRLAAGVAHEINNPLTGVLTFAHLLKEDEELGPQGQKDLDLIIHETTRVAQIVRGLLDFARERPSVKERLNVNDVVRRTIRLLGNQEAFQRVVVVEDLDEGLPPVDGDVNQLQQVLLNLSLNACEAMPGGGTLLIDTSADDGRLLVKVTDTGCGIKPEHLGRIFEPFFSTKSVGKGTGLGLSVSYGIVQQHGGTLEVESDSGQGTTFTVVLPASLGKQPTSRRGKVNQ